MAEVTKEHWICVSEVTTTARGIIEGMGGRCLDLPSGMPPFVVVMLPTDVPDWGIFFWDDGFNLNMTMGNDVERPTVTLYSRNISSTLIQESIVDLVLSTLDEWRVYCAGSIARSGGKE